MALSPLALFAAYNVCIVALCGYLLFVVSEHASPGGTRAASKRDKVSRCGSIECWSCWIRAARGKWQLALQLCEDVGNVVLDGALAELKHRTNLAVAIATCHQPQYVGLRYTAGSGRYSALG